MRRKFLGGETAPASGVLRPKTGPLAGEEVLEMSSCHAVATRPEEG